jgi:phytoene dehydrogenase-like protein
VTSSARRFDAVVVGGGHNGLTCAAYLAAAGLAVCVVERRAVVGGAAVTEEFRPGFRNSTASYTVSLLDPQVIRDLNLARHGLVIRERPFSNFLPLPDGGYLKVGGGLAATQAEVARFSRADAAALPAYYAMLDRVAGVLRGLLGTTPPNVGGGGKQDVAMLVDLVKTAKGFRKLTLPERRDLLDLFTKSAGDLLDRWFASAPIKAAFGFDAVVGNFASPYTPGSAYVLLHHVFGEVNGKPGQWGHAVGGMGAITQAMAAECAARGVVVRTRAPVARVVVKAGRAAGVELADGEVIEGKRVVANVNPKLLCEQLVAPEHLPDDFRARIAGYRCGSGTFRMNVALAELPSFTALPGRDAQPHHSSGIIMAPSLAYMERAYFDARTAGWSSAPIVEILIPSTVDDTLAPAGMHVASLFCQHVHPDLPAVADGRTWDDAREEVAERMLATVDGFAPGFRASVLGYRALSPLDLEREFGLIGGDIFHGALSLDQLFSARPVLGHGNYRMPVPGLYLCGSGAHPGGGVTGIPGRNAAREIVKDVRRRRH